MDKLSTYRAYIQNLLNKYKSYTPISKNIEVEIVSDIENDHYQLVHVGWNKNRRVYGCAFHIDIKHNKVWIQYNGTDRKIAEELVELGIPKDDIVLGFQSEYRRKFTEYAIK
ncbi:XisI protein [Candidatus Magnetomorum sp. HK-1]|nr:XisI protein [Candidatus Magnetomorum sp. HK-1]